MDDESKSREIDQIVEKARQHLQDKDYKHSAALVKNALEAYPKNKKLSELYSQIKYQYKEEKIQKLQEEAIMFMRTGAEDQAQIRLRQILQLDPMRTELAESLRNTRAESSETYHKRMKHAELIQAILKVVLVSFAILAIFCWWAGWDNNRHLKKAEKLITAGDLYGAKQSFGKCGWFWAGKKHKIYNALQASVNSLIEQGRNYIKSKHFAEAISCFEQAELAAKDVAAVKQQIEDCRRKEKQWQEELVKLEQEKERQRVLSDKALAAKEEFNKIFAIALENSADIDAKTAMEDCNSMAVEAESIFELNNFELSRSKWIEATGLCQKAIKIAEELSKKRKDALAEKLKCDKLAETAQKMKANAISPDTWQQGQENSKSAEKYFSETNFEKAKQEWLLAANKFDEAIQAIMQSPDYQKASMLLKKWSWLKAGMIDKEVRLFLGAPKRVQAASDSSIWYYQSVPVIVEVDSNSYKCPDIEYGYIKFTTTSMQDCLGNIRDIYQKNIDQEQKLYEDLRSKSDKIPYRYRPKEARIILCANGTIETSASNGTKVIHQTIDSITLSSAATPDDKRHHEKLKGLFTDFQTKIKNLINGTSPMEVNYIVSEWNLPDQADLTSLLTVDKTDGNDVTPTSKWHYPSRWKSLNLNIRQGDVQTALGEPENISSAGGKIIYTYGNIEGYGVLIFETRVDSSKRLSYWKEPLWSQVRRDLQKATLSDPNQNVVQTSNTE